jgi:hypothetical protein
MAAAAIAIGIGAGGLLALERGARPSGDAAGVRTLENELVRLRAERERDAAAARARLERLERAVVEEPAPDHARTETPASNAPDRTPGPTDGSESSPITPPTATMASRAEAPPPTAVPSDPSAADAEAVPPWLEQLLSAGARVMALGAADFASGASGYAVWSPERGVVVVSASGLPRDGREAVYRVRVGLSDGSTAWVGDLSAGERGALLVTVAVPQADGRRVIGVDLYRDPPGSPALTASRRPADADAFGK